MSAALLSVRQLKVHFPLPGNWPWQPTGWLKAVDGVDLDLHPGQTLGVVGESGCGKSTLARAISGLQATTSGGIVFNERDITGLDTAGWRRLRRDVQVVFQDPLASLNPRMTIGQIVAEPLRNLFPEYSKTQRWQKVRDMLVRVGLSTDMVNRYPHEFSGGQCQRVGIARALVVGPKVLICDEAVSALDVSIQAQILDLLATLQAELNIAILFIAHDLAVVRDISDQVMVMYLGRVMETATASQLFRAPAHPYTRALLSAVPRPDPETERARRRIALTGDLPSPADPPSGCVFRTRCPWVQDDCARRVPALRQVGGPVGNPNDSKGSAACLYAEDFVAAA